MPTSRKKSSPPQPVDADTQPKHEVAAEGGSGSPPSAPVPAVKGFLRRDGTVVSPSKKLKMTSNPNGKFSHRKPKGRKPRASTRAAAANIRAQLAADGMYDGDDDDDDLEGDYNPSEEEEEEEEIEEETQEDRDFINDESQDEGVALVVDSDESYEPPSPSDEEMDVETEQSGKFCFSRPRQFL